MSNGCMMTIAPNPFTMERVSIPVQGGVSLREMLSHAPGGPSRLWVCIDGVPIPESEWEWIYPDTDAVITARRQVGEGGGGGSGKNIGQIIAGVVLIAVGIALAGGSYGALSPYGAQIALLGAGLVLSGVVGLVTAKPKSSVDTAVGGPDRFSIQSARNAFEPYGVIPKIFGTVRTYPKAGALPFTEISGGDQYLRQIFVVGYGPLAISDIRIGDTPIANFEGVEVETREGLSSDLPLTLYRRDVDENVLSILVNKSDGWIQQTTIPGVDTISIDLTAQAGLGFFQDDGDFKGLTVHLAVEYAVSGSGTWVAIPGSFPVTVEVDFISQASNGRVRISRNASVLETFVTGDVVEFQGVLGMNEVNGNTYTITVIDGSHFDLNVNTTGFGAYTSGGTATVMREVVFGGKSPTVVRQNKTWNVAVGQYDVRIRRISPDTSSPSISDKITWTALRTFSDIDPIQKPELALIAMRIKASDELNGVIDQLNCIASAKYQVYNGSNWSLQASNSPAWAYVDVLTGAGNDAAMDLSRIDADALKVWADNCATAGREFNYPLNNDLPIRDMLGLIATAGRATIHINDGLYSVVEDVSQSVLKGHISPRNSWDYETQRVFVELPHAIKAEFLDETNGYRQETQIVYRSGYSESNATKFESKTFEGVTNPTQIWKELTFHLASLMVRAGTHSVSMDPESLTFQRGDWVRLSAPAALIGASAARVKAVGVSGSDVVTVTLDAMVTMETGSTYAVQMRDANNVAIDQPVDFVAGDQTLLTFTTPIPDSGPQPAVGDLVLFGKENFVSADMIVKAITHFDGVHARLELIDRADSIHQADQGTPPVWVPHVTLPANPLGQILPVPVIEHIDSSELFLIRGPEGSLQVRMSVQLRLPSGSHGLISYYQVHHRLQDPIEGPGDWITSPFSLAVSGEVMIAGVLEGQTYDVRARSTNGVGLVSAWSPIVFHTVVGKSSPPPDVLTFTVSRDADGTRRFEWTFGVKPLDFAGVKIKWKVGTGHDWEDLADLHTDVLSTSPFETNQLAQGTYTFGIKMVDTSGNESTNAVIIEGFLDDPRLGGALVQQSARAQGWPGTKTDCVVEGSGDLVAKDTTTTWADLESITWDDWGQWNRSPENPIVYEHSVIDVGAVLTFNPLASFSGTGTPTITEAHSDDDVTYTSFAALGGQITARYIKIKVSLAHAFAIFEDLNIIIDAEIQVEDIQDVDMSTLSGSTGLRRLALNKTFSVISSVTLILQNVGPGYSWDIIDKDVALGPQIKTWNASDTLVDVSAVDAVVRGVA